MESVKADEKTKPPKKGIFTMKRIVSALLVCVLLAACVFTLVSCGPLSGTYSGTLCDLTFSGNKVTASIGDDSIEGTYEVTEDDKGNKSISFDFIESEDDKGILAAIDAILGSKVPLKVEDDSITIAYIFKFNKK